MCCSVSLYQGITQVYLTLLFINAHKDTIMRLFYDLSDLGNYVA